MQGIVNIVEHYGFIIVLLIAAISIIRFVVNLAAKVITLAIVIGLILVYVFHMSPTHVFQTESSVMNQSVQALQKAVVPILSTELKNAHYSIQVDGTYDITTEHVKLEGKKGNSTATVDYEGHSFPINLQILGSGLQNEINQHINSLTNNKP